MQKYFQVTLDLFFSHHKAPVQLPEQLTLVNLLTRDVVLLNYDGEAVYQKFYSSNFGPRIFSKCSFGVRANSQRADCSSQIGRFGLVRLVQDCYSSPVPNQYSSKNNIHGGPQSTVDDILSSCPSAPGSILSVSKFFPEFLDVAEIYRQQCTGQSVQIKT